MPLYMTQFAYTAEALAKLVKNPEDRSVPVGALIEKLGGRLLNFYYCLGEYDGIAITEAADEETVLSVLFAVITPGHLRATKTTVLFTMDQATEAMNRAGKVVFAAPKE